MSEMSLSSAIRLGAMLKPQGRGIASMRSADASCALGAAADALGLADVNKYSRLRATWPVLDQRLGCPVCGHPPPPGTVVAVLWHLNDTHWWTREQIADFVETLESERQQADASPRTDHAVAGALA